jgi:hypothetical protein
MIKIPQGLGPDPVHAPLPVGAGLDQAGLAQNPQVLGHCRLTDSQLGDQIGHRPLGIA